MMKLKNMLCFTKHQINLALTRRSVFRIPSSSYTISCSRRIRGIAYSHLNPKQLNQHRLIAIRGRHDNGNGRKDTQILMLRLGARALGNIASYLWRHGYIQAAWRNRRTRNGGLLLLLLSLPVLLSAGLVISHVEVVPYSGRLNIVFLSKDEEQNLGSAGETAILIQEVKRVLPASHATVKEVQMIADRLQSVCHEEGLLPSSKHFHLHVIDSPIANAFVLPNGAIFVYTGLVPYAETEAGLAAIIGHEMAHSLARHSAEKIGLINMLMIATEFFRGWSDHERRWYTRNFEFLAASLLQTLYTLAHSRQLESEADAIGIRLSAKAGYDPRHAAQVWKKFLLEEGKSAKDTNKEKDLNQEGNPDTAVAKSLTSLSASNRLQELLSTHPCHQRRIEELEEYSIELMETYRKASEDLFMQKNIWDTSTHLLTRQLRNPRIGDILGSSLSEEDFMRSKSVANEAVSLMVGERGEEWREFLKSLKIQQEHL
mmetsp:Transcript_26861/g.45320  ORF Transcript_26861/g.45320 Transcript_26861/m.45320 type:complete len:486 (-) Transcript_26861:2501-3958(-)